ncbi:hypothetical protein HPB49_013477 [Dermacentor silvarum]|uniref:Uncharacterized protein n=1 Tax=Dermacentor silvarum TaxID=543639 RepID=A0ACB8C403_DERSI|nr:hypothetical protein HPB49_013477 [Dermacentor silvarum]
MPVTASKVVRVKRTPSVPLGPRSSQAVLPESAVHLQADLAPPIASKPESSAEADDAERIFEPKSLLEVYNNTLEVAPLKRAGLNDGSLPDTSSTSSTDASGDYVPPVVNKKKEHPQAPKRLPPKKSTVLREYRTRRRKRQCRKQDPQVVAPSAKRNASNKNDNVNVAMMSSKNCIDRPCVVSMYHLNDQVLANGFVNLTTVKHEDLFLLASSPVVRLSSDKLVSVVELKPRASDTLQQSAEVSSITDTDNLERLLKEQQNELVNAAVMQYYHEGGFTVLGGLVDNWPSYLSRDGVHPSRFGNKVLTEYLYQVACILSIHLERSHIQQCYKETRAPSWTSRTQQDKHPCHLRG